MASPADLPSLVTRRDALLQEIAAVGDFWRGSLVPRYTKCGKSGCRCAEEGHPGHGPYWSVIHESDGKTRTRNIPSGALPRVRGQIDEYRRFRGLVREFGDVSNRLCVAQLEADGSARPAKRGGLKQRSRPKPPA